MADLSDPLFDGEIIYDAPDDGNVAGGDVEIFAAGNRNPFSVTLHSNGLLYGTDNGPNLDYGPVSTGCDSQEGDVEEEDKINLLVRSERPALLHMPFSICKVLTMAFTGTWQLLWPS